MRIRPMSCAIPFALLVLVASASAQPAGKETNVMIRAIARDAKVIGQHVGGARITSGTLREKSWPKESSRRERAMQP
jgi:hypothetical protein